MLKTAFWQRAAASLPPQVRARYAADLVMAERRDLALTAIVDWFKSRSRVARSRFAHP
jgi:hypothetical protein